MSSPRPISRPGPHRRQAPPRHPAPPGRPRTAPLTHRCRRQRRWSRSPRRAWNARPGSRPRTPPPRPRWPWRTSRRSPPGPRRSRPWRRTCWADRAR
ncbi:hypothetical protein ACFFX0_27410 [Citricoccus parietis]|uniref:Uncharacterized protein n=1 Tax=Citricoccus parietis TaxID=592307 RepID=A0ABV5G6Z5_9MICC